MPLFSKPTLIGVTLAIFTLLGLVWLLCPIHRVQIFEPYYPEFPRDLLLHLLNYFKYNKYYKNIPLPP